MSFNPIGVHFLPTHTGQHHYNFIRDMQSGILKLVASSTPDVQQIVDGYAAAPNALLYLRNVARSEQHDFLWRDPVGAATQHVKEWHTDIQERTQQARDRGLAFPSIEQLRILGVNEPIIELFPRQEDMSNYAEWLAMQTQRSALLDSYMETFGLEANKLGYGAGLGNISSGQPANRKPGEYATFDWFPKTRKLLESTRGKNAYTCHEYWRAETGPEGHADWHAWRFTHLNVDCDIDILESGVDQRITSEPDNGNRGWVGHMDAGAYVEQHRRYINRARQDSRFRCETPFTLDGDKIWESFWIEYCMPEMVALSSVLRASTPPQPTKPIVSPGPQPVPPSQPPAYVIAPAGAWLRQGPVSGHKIVAVPYGDEIFILGDSTPGWVLVRYGDKTGYMASRWISPHAPEPLPAPTEPPVQPPPQDDNWSRAWPIVLKIEGGLSMDERDKGNWTGGAVGVGTLKGTKFGISAASYPNLDIANLTKEQALDLYRRDYWIASGADKLAWPLALIHFDSFVQNKVAAARFLKDSGGNVIQYLADRLHWYTTINDWSVWGAGWANRIAHMLREVAKSK